MTHDPIDCKHLGSKKCPHRDNDALIFMSSVITTDDVVIPSSVAIAAMAICTHCPQFEKT